MNNVYHEGTRRVVPFNVAIAAASSLLVHMPWLETYRLLEVIPLDPLHCAWMLIERDVCNLSLELEKIWMKFF